MKDNEFTTVIDPSDLIHSPTHYFLEGSLESMEREAERSIIVSKLILSLLRLANERTVTTPARNECRVWAVGPVDDRTARNTKNYCSRAGSLSYHIVGNGETLRYDIADNDFIAQTAQYASENRTDVVIKAGCGRYLNHRQDSNTTKEAKYRNMPFFGCSSDNRLLNQTFSAP
ncbi:Retaining alpha-galactosidase [Dirofilaria immitis]